MKQSRAPTQGLALLSLCALATLIASRISQTQMRTPVQGNQYSTLPAWRIDLDRAGPDELAALPGIGPALAAAIVKDRNMRGPFQTLSGLDRVRGVGPAILSQIKPFVLQPPQ